MTVLLLKPMCFKDALHFFSHILSISCRENMGPNEHKNWTLFVEEEIYLSLKFKFFSIIQDILLEYSKNFIFGTLKKKHVLYEHLKLKSNDIRSCGTCITQNMC